MSALPPNSFRRFASFTLIGLVLIAAGAAIGLLYEKSPEKRNIEDVASGACEEVTQSANLEEVNRIVPSSASFDVSEETRQRPGVYIANCKIEADGEQVLLVTVDLKGFSSFGEWDEYVTDERLIPAEGRKKLDAGGGGYSTPEAAGAFVPCTVVDDDDPEDREQMGMSVFVRTTVDGDHRDDLTTIATHAAEAAAEVTLCED